MEVSSDRRHTFDVSPAELWEAMAHTDQYRRWWPWLRGFEATGLTAGDRWSAVVQPPLPYRLRFEVVIDQVVEQRSVTATVEGDIAGTAHLEIEALAHGSALHVVSCLSPANPVLAAVARVGQPVARFGHDWVLDTGLRQFRHHALG